MKTKNKTNNTMVWIMVVVIAWIGGSSRVAGECNATLDSNELNYHNGDGTQHIAVACNPNCEGVMASSSCITDNQYDPVPPSDERVCKSDPAYYGYKCVFQTLSATVTYSSGTPYCSMGENNACVSGCADWVTRRRSSVQWQMDSLEVCGGC